MAKKISLQAKLLFGIFLVISLSAVFYFRIQNQREAALKEQAESPRARVDRAIERAQRATINKEFRAAETAYGEALETIAEVLQDKPNNLKLMRSQLFVLRQLAHWSNRRGDEKTTYEWASQAVAVAKSILDVRPTETRARRDRIATAVTFARSGPLAEADVLDTLKAAILQVEGTTPDAKPGPPVREMLARAWQQMGKRYGADKQYKEAYSAFRTALKWARSGTSADELQSTLKSLTYTIADTGNEVAMAEGNKKVQQAFQYEIVAALILGTRINNKSAKLHSMLATRRAKLADLLQEMGDVTRAEKLYEEAVSTLAAAVKAHPKVKRMNLSWVRALNHQGAFYSGLNKNEAALAAYKKAYEASLTLKDGALRTRLISMGNYAQLLGRLDRTIAARTIASDAYKLATTLHEDKLDSRRAREDKQSAGLRLARLLRAPPKARKANALTLARTLRQTLVLSTPPTNRQKGLKKGFDALIVELQNK